MIVLASDLVGFEILEFLAGRRHPIDLVVVHPSDRGGMNEQITRLSASHGLRLTDASELGRQSFLDELTLARPLIGVLAWWPSILRGRIAGVPTMGWLNLHPSLLPHNRGKNPNFWCLAEMTPCGVSLHFIDAGVDSGPIVAQAQVEVGWEDTGQTVYVRCRERIVELFRESFDDILAGLLLPVAQDLAYGSYHSSLEMESRSDLKLDEPTTARRVFNVIRARMFPPYPSARFHDGGKTYSVEIVIREVSGDD